MPHIDDTAACSTRTSLRRISDCSGGIAALVPMRPSASASSRWTNQRLSSSAAVIAGIAGAPIAITSVVARSVAVLWSPPYALTIAGTTTGPIETINLVKTANSSAL